MNINSKCGCDPCLDAETFTNTDTAPCCDLCPEYESPCVWIAKFGCVVRPDSGCDNPDTRGIACANVYLRQNCYFGAQTIGKACIEGDGVLLTVPGGNCVWVALGRRMSDRPGCNYCAPCAGMNERGILAPEAAPCSWNNITTTSPITEFNPILIYGISWVLTILAADSTLEWDHPTLGLLQYTKAEAWDCAGPNTMTLTAGGDVVPELPQNICVVPEDKPGVGGCGSATCYDSAGERCACCDECCTCIEGGVTATCDNFPGAPTITGDSGNLCSPPTHTPVGTAAGIVREGEYTFSLGGESHTINIVLYCDGTPGGWKADWYLDGDFLATTDLENCCCNLAIGGPGPDISYEFPGCELYFAAASSLLEAALRGDCDVMSPPCYEGTDEFDVDIGECGVGLGELELHFERISPRCWEATKDVGCGVLRVRICCFAGGLVSSWSLPCATPASGTLTVTGTPDTTITLSNIDCEDVDINNCTPCPPCGTTLPDQPLYYSCPDPPCSESTTVTPTIGGGNGLAGVDSPSGPTWGGGATLCGVLLELNWYYTGCQWKFDAYNDSVFCGTFAITHTCCPLVLGTAFGSCPGSECCFGTEPCAEPCSGGCFWLAYEQLPDGSGIFVWPDVPTDDARGPCAEGCSCSPPDYDPTFAGEVGITDCYE